MIIYQALFFDISRKTQVEQKLRFLTKLRYFSKNSGSKNVKRYPNRKYCDGTTFFMYLGCNFFQKLRPIFLKLRSIFVKLRSVYEKLRSEFQKTYLNRKLTSWGAPEKCRKKKPAVKYIFCPKTGTIFKP